MSAPRDASSSVSPWVQAQRMEQAARGEQIARTLRDADLTAAGGTAESLALIGGRRALTAEGAADVALWLYDLAARYSLDRAAAVLYLAAIRDKAPKPGEHPFGARTRAGLALVRQILDAALEDANAEAPAPGARADSTEPQQTRAPGARAPRMQGAHQVGVWLASMVEGAGQSEVARTLYEQDAEGAATLDATEADGEAVRAAAQHAADRLTEESEQ